MSLSLWRSQTKICYGAVLKNYIWIDFCLTTTIIMFCDTLTAGCIRCIPSVIQIQTDDSTSSYNDLPNFLLDYLLYSWSIKTELNIWQLQVATVIYINQQQFIDVVCMRANKWNKHNLCNLSRNLSDLKVLIGTDQLEK